MNTNAENTRGADAPPSPAEKSDRFPFVTVGAAGGALFAFLFLMWFVTTLPNTPDPQRSEVKSEPKPNAAKLDDLKEHNENALNGVGAKMSRAEARGKLLGKLKGPDDKMPFPTPEPPLPAPPKKDEPKKENKK